MPRKNEPWYRAERDGWYVNIGGRRVLLAKGKANRKAAQAKFHQLKAEADRAKPASPGDDLLVGDVCQAYRDHAARRLSPLTSEFYKRHLASFMRFRGHQKVADLTPHDVDEWLAKHAAKPVDGRSKPWGPTTQAGAVTAVRRAFRWAHRTAKLIPANPLEGIERPTPQVREHILTADQAEAIRASVTPGDPFGDLLDFLRATGCRPSEAYAFTADHFQRAERVVVFDRGKTTRATGRKRVIHLTERIADRVAELAERFPSGPILRALPPTTVHRPTDADRPPWTRHVVAHRFERIRARLRLGAEATAESYRHLFATDALEAGVPIATVAELMGHTSTAMVERHYSKLGQRRGHLREALNSFRD